MNSTLMSRKWLSELWRYRELAYCFAWRGPRPRGPGAAQPESRAQNPPVAESGLCRATSLGHSQLITIPGIGIATAAVLVAKVIDIDRFPTPEQFVGYFGVFPEENS